jgi:hypothetical protein
MDEPSPPDLPQYVLKGVDTQSPEDLLALAEYAEKLAAWKRFQGQEDTRKRREQSRHKEQKKDLEERDEEVSTDPEAYDVPPSAYITVKEPKPGYEYYYWQWREDDTWKNEYIAPVNPKQ